MTKVYNDKESIIKALDSDGFITGIVEMDFTELLNNTIGIDFINEKACDLLVTEDYSYLLEDISYKLISSNLEKQTILVQVKAFVNLSETEYKYIYK